MTHPDEARLNDYADRLLDPDAAADVEAHLARCDACRARVEAIRELTGRLASLPRDIPPRRDLRPEVGVRADARAPGARDDGRSAAETAAPAGAGPVGARWTSWLRTAAVLVGLVGSAAALWLLLPGPEPPFPTDPVIRSYAQAAGELETTVRSRGAELSPEAAGALATSLETVEGAIRELEQARRAGEADVDRLLEARYRVKLDLLRDALDLLEESS